jgi:aminomethyltransferase
MVRNDKLTRALQARALQSAARRVRPQQEMSTHQWKDGAPPVIVPGQWSQPTARVQPPKCSALWSAPNTRDRWEEGNPTSAWVKPRERPWNLRQTGDGGMMEKVARGSSHDGLRLCLEQRLRKSPFFHLALDHGCWAYSVYNKHYLPKAYADPAEGGLLKEYEWLTTNVAMWDVAIERQVRVRGPDAEKFVDRVITRRVASCEVGKGKYVVLCNQEGGILNDPVLLRLKRDEFWFSIADSDIALYLQGVNVGLGMDVEIAEVDVSPVQIQGPKSTALMTDLVGPEIEQIPYYGLMQTKVADCDVTISRTGFSAERGYEIYLHDATQNAERLWYAVLDAGEAHNLRVTSTSHIRRIEAGILSYGQDMDIETNPYECGLGWQVDLSKDQFVGKDALARIKAQGASHKLCGIKFGGDPITWYPSDMYQVKSWSGDLIGHLTSAFFSPAVGCNVGFAFLPTKYAAIDNTVEVILPQLYNKAGRLISGEICKTPFKMPGKEELGTALRTQGGSKL